MKLLFVVGCFSLFIAIPLNGQIPLYKANTTTILGNRFDGVLLTLEDTSVAVFFPYTAVKKLRNKGDSSKVLLVIQPVRSVNQIEIRLPSASRGLATGGLGGFVVGSVIGLAAYNPDCGGGWGSICYTSGESVLIGGISFAIIGGLVGVLTEMGSKRIASFDISGSQQRYSLYKEELGKYLLQSSVDPTLLKVYGSHSFTFFKICYN